MPSIALRPFRPCDLARLDPPLLPPEAAAGLEPPPGAAFSALAGGRVLGCAGVIVPHGSRCGRAWALLGDDLRARPFLLHRLAARGLDSIARRHCLTRIEASVQADFAAGRRWLEALGFRCEGRLPDTPGGERFLRYERHFPISPSFGPICSKVRCDC